MHFSEAELIQCGFDLADLHQLPTPPVDKLKQKITEILIDRENYKAALQGLITREETASLVLQHFQTLICHCSHQEEAKLTKGWQELVPLTVQALFKE